MHKFIRHIFSFNRQVILVAGLFICSNSSAQFTDTPKDSVVYFTDVSMQPFQATDTRPVPDSTIQNLKRNEAYWYADVAPQKKIPKKQDSSTPFLQRGWMKDLAWFIIIGCFAAVLIWFLASSNIRLFRKPPATIVSEEESFTTEDFFSLNYEKEIKKSVDAKEYRLAVRLLYLRTLKDLADKEIIRYKQERTNSDYLFDLSGTTYYKDFFRLTRDFEYSWYGKFDISDDAFSMMHTDFTNFKQRIAS
jgi:hypothetical protein